MMPLRFVPTGPAIERDGRKVVPLAIETTCDVCGADAPFGEAVRLRQAIAERRADLAGRWWCGYERGRGGYCKAAVED